MPRLEYLDYTQITQMKDDPLWYIKKLSIDFTFHKFVKRVNLYVLIYNVTLFLVQVCYILYSPNRKTMIANYGPMMGIILFILCEMFTSRMCESAIKSQLDELHSISWSFANVEPTVILGESRPLFVFAFVVLAAYLSSVSFVTPLFTYERDIFLFREIFEARCAKIAEAIFWVTSPVLVYSGAVNLCIFFYFVVSWKTQLFLVNHYLENVAEDFQNGDQTHLYHCAHYQQEISKRLRFVIKQHVALILFVKKMMKIFRIIINLHVFLIFVITVSMVFFLINLFSGDDWRANIRSVHLTLTSFIAVIFLITLCHQVPEMTAQTFDAAAGLPWHLWDSKNRKILLILMANSVHPVYLNVPKFGRVDYGSIVDFIQTLYSITTVLYQLRDQNF